MRNTSRGFILILAEVNRLITSSDTNKSKDNVGHRFELLFLEQLLCDTIEDAGGFLSVTFQSKYDCGVIKVGDFYRLHFI